MSDLLFFLLTRNLTFVLELFAAEGLFISIKKKNPRLVLKFFLIAVTGIIVVLGTCGIQTLFVGSMNFENIGFLRCVSGVTLHLLLFAYTVVSLKFVCDGSVYKLIFSCSMGYCVRQLINNLYLLIFNIVDDKLILLKFGQLGLKNILVYATFTVIAYVIAYLLFGKQKLKTEQSLDKSVFAIFAIVLLLNVVIGTVSEIYSSNDKTLRIICLIDQIASMALVIVLQMFILNHVKDKNELQTTKQLVKMQADQYRFSKSSIDRLNVKIHDLKHQIPLLRAGGEQADKILDELSELTTDYDGIIKTENEAINLIVTEKWLFCREHSIKLVYSIAPHCFDYLDNSDLFSLVGNILDNAIGATLKCEQAKRHVNLKIFNRNGVDILVCDNYCSVPPVIVDGFPVSTKPDKENHGFGVRSIKYISESYGGNLSISADGNIFTVRVCIPVPSPKTPSDKR